MISAAINWISDFDFWWFHYTCFMVAVLLYNADAMLFWMFLIQGNCYSFFFLVPNCFFWIIGFKQNSLIKPIFLLFYQGYLRKRRSFYYFITVLFCQYYILHRVAWTCIYKHIHRKACTSYIHGHAYTQAFIYTHSKHTVYK